MKKIHWAKWDKLPPGRPVFSRKDTVEDVERISESYTEYAQSIKTCKKILVRVDDHTPFAAHKVRFYMCDVTDEEIEKLKTEHKKWVLHIV